MSEVVGSNSRNIYMKEKGSEKGFIVSEGPRIEKVNDLTQEGHPSNSPHEIKRCFFPLMG
jgi:hypothetical protein